MVRMATWFLYLVLIVALAFIGFAAWVRFAPSDPAVWHVDPVTAPMPSSPNAARVERLVAMPVDQVATYIETRARTEGATLLAGDVLFGTWIARTALMRYPDYVSIRLTAEGEGTRIVALSRARFGYSDRGVNAARLGRWLPQAEP